ncbi:hypothetical protein RFI_12360 [Reticulomyxa filosa]|uniref:Uncharacterized protein n=1 Tax=Reticulomyxa filosa TaxID=46433 RepID=X6NFQ1_RETFI|nr:hypothetical protein RFI_12360 [Reticulomyxa filosa]|eukprot:ETO24796.1 hypothetical protein RFI_12360 [Reticulomyxa filosa]
MEHMNGSNGNKGNSNGNNSEEEECIDYAFGMGQYKSGCDDKQKRKKCVINELEGIGGLYVRSHSFHSMSNSNQKYDQNLSSSPKLKGHDADIGKHNTTKLDDNSLSNKTQGQTFTLEKVSKQTENFHNIQADGDNLHNLIQKDKHSRSHFNWSSNPLICTGNYYKSNGKNESSKSSSLLIEHKIIGENSTKQTSRNGSGIEIGIGIDIGVDENIALKNNSNSQLSNFKATTTGAPHSNARNNDHIEENGEIDDSGEDSSHHEHSSASSDSDESIEERFSAVGNIDNPQMRVNTIGVTTSNFKSLMTKSIVGMVDRGCQCVITQSDCTDDKEKEKEKKKEREEEKEREKVRVKEIENLNKENAIHYGYLMEQMKRAQHSLEKVRGFVRMPQIVGSNMETKRKTSRRGRSRIARELKGNCNNNKMQTYIHLWEAVIEVMEDLQNQ